MREKRRRALSAARVSSVSARWVSASPDARDDDKTWGVLHSGQNIGRAMIRTTSPQEHDDSAASETLFVFGVSRNGQGPRRTTALEKFAIMRRAFLRG